MITISKFEYTVVSLVFCFIVGSSSAQYYWTAPGVGNTGQGAGMVIVNIDNNPALDMILMAYDDPEGANSFRYRFLWNMITVNDERNYDDPHFDNTVVEVPGVGYEAEGAGISVTNLDENPRPDMILMAYDNPEGPNTFRYKIGWNLNSSGIAATWSSLIMIEGMGSSGQGAGIRIVNLDNNSRPDLVLVAYDNPEGPNSFRYKIGWNLNEAGLTAHWSNIYTVPGLGSEGCGAGVTFANVDGNPRPEMILMAYDDPDGPNTFRYRVGWNIDEYGEALMWSDGLSVGGVGNEAQGADIFAFNFDQRDSLPELFLMAYDNPEGPNTFRIKIINWGNP